MEKEKAEYHLASNYMYRRVVHLEVYEERHLLVDLYGKIEMLGAFQKDRKWLNYSLQYEIYWEGFPYVVYIC